VRHRPSNPADPARTTGPTIISTITPTLVLVLKPALSQSSKASAFSIQAAAWMAPPKEVGQPAELSKISGSRSPGQRTVPN